MTQEEKEKIIKEYIEKQKLTAVENMELETKVSLIEEAGEIIGVFKKLQFHKHRDKDELKEKLAEEIGDFIWYLTQYARENNLLEELEENLYIRLDYKSKLNGLNDKVLYDMCYDLILDVLKISKLDKDYTSYSQYFNDYVRNSFYIISIVNNHFKGYKLEEILKRNIEKLEKRYKDRVEKNG